MNSTQEYHMGQGTSDYLAITTVLFTKCGILLDNTTGKSKNTDFINLTSDHNS